MFKNNFKNVLVKKKKIWYFAVEYAHDDILYDRR